MTMNKHYAAAVMSCILLLAGCSQYLTETSEQGIVYCAEGSPSTFNPQLDTSGTTIDATAYQLYDRLLSYDSKQKRLIPGLASSYLVSEDGLTYTFQLRRGVSFHQTPYFQPSRNFNASDVIFSVNRWRIAEHPYHQVSGGHYPYFESLGLADNIQEVKRINGYRVVIQLKQQDSSFLANLASDFAIILSAEYAGQLQLIGQPHKLDSLPVGTGPYKYKAYKQNHYIKYSPHQDYWRDDIKRLPLIFDITQTSAMRISKLVTGECDVIAFPAHEEIDVLAQNEHIKIDSKPGLNVGFWAFNTTKPPFDDRRVRTALAMAVDKDTLLNTIYFDKAVKAKGLVPPSSWAYDPSQGTPSYSPTLAKELLAEAGFADGFEMTIWAMPVQRAYNPDAIKMAELIQNYLSAVGVKVNIVTYAWSTFRKKLLAGTYDSVLIGWTADNLDPDNFFRPLLTCQSGSNRSNWCNQQYDEFINLANKNNDQEQRRLLYKQAISLINTELPLLPIAHANRYQLSRKNISNMTINPMGGISFVDVEKLP